MFLVLADELGSQIYHCFSLGSCEILSEEIIRCDK